MDSSGVNLDHSIGACTEGSGPIVFRNASDLNSNNPLYLLGVVSGFPKDLSPVMTPKKIKDDQDTSNVEQWRIIRLKDGQKAIMRDTDQVVNLNPGIVIGYGIKHAIDLIRKNP